MISKNFIFLILIVYVNTELIFYTEGYKNFEFQTKICFNNLNSSKINFINLYTHSTYYEVQFECINIETNESYIFSQNSDNEIIKKINLNSGYWNSCFISENNGNHFYYRLEFDYKSLPDDKIVYLYSLPLIIIFIIFISILATLYCKYTVYHREYERI